MAFKHLNLHNFPQLKATTTPEGRRYRVGDSLYPSVTTVIGHSKKKKQEGIPIVKYDLSPYGITGNE